MQRCLDDRSLRKLAGVDPRLVQLVQEAFNASPIPFVVTEGLRDANRQAYLFASGKSQTLSSKHLNGHAVDIAAIVDGRINWQFDHYKAIAGHFFDVASRLGVRIKWGGAWPKFRDGCHFELA